MAKDKKNEIEAFIDLDGRIKKYNSNRKKEKDNIVGEV